MIWLYDATSEHIYYNLLNLINLTVYYSSSKEMGH